MNAIQRWYFTDEPDSEMREATPGRTAEDELWCRAKDVSDLEGVLAKSLERTTRARADRTISEDLVKSLRVEIIEKDNLILNQEIEITRLKEIEWMYAELLT